MEPRNTELDLEDLMPSQWLAQCDANEEEEQELSLDSLCDDGDYMQSILLDSANDIPHISPLEEIEQLPFDCPSLFLHDTQSHSPNFSGDLDDSPKVSGDLCTVSDFDFDFLAANYPSNILALDNNEETQSPFPPNEVVKSRKCSNKRARSHSITSNFQNKRTHISSPMSVLDQAHCVDGNSTKFAICLEAKKQELHEPHSKTGSPRKHSKKGSTSHSDAHLSKESKWAQQLLKACASAIASNNISRTQHLMWVLNDLASFIGNANQRLAASGLKALFSRVTGVPPSPNFASSDSNSSLTAASLHRALLKFQDASPWHKCTYTIANGAIVEACEGHDIIHVVDIGISQGTQWPTLIEALATRASGVPKLLKITMVENELGSASFVSRLEPFAKRLGLNLKLKSISKPLESLTSKDFELELEEELIVCLQFRLHHLTQEANEEETCKRDKFLEFIHTLNPNTFILSENDIDHCSLDFLTRFQKAMEFQWSFLDSTSASFQGQESEERQIMEAKASLAFTNIVAFEGTSRTERNETHIAWSSRVQKCGFSSYLPGAQVLESAKSLLRKHSGDWNMLVEDGTMALRWKGNPTTFCSLWKPYSSN